MKELDVKVLSNKLIARDTYELVLEADLRDLEGEFLELKVRGFSLRRPLSVCNYDKTTTIIYKVVGDGTKELSTYKAGDMINILGPCGNTFPIKELDEVLLVGGGVGLPPLYELAKKFIARGTKVTLVMGFNDKDDVFYLDEFKALGCKVYVSTMNGSLGTKGTAIDCIKENNITLDTVYACGPKPLLVALEKKYTKGYISFEARMACGFGICNACAIMTKHGAKKICKDGPVFEVGEIIYE